MSHRLAPLPALLTVVLAAGCVTEGPPKPPATRPKPVVREDTRPATLVISPLTRITMEGVGGPSIQLHLDFHDGSGRSTKAYGKVHVELYGGASPGAGSKQEFKQLWDWDLSDALKNALTFDEMITRTYTLPLSGIPDWLLQWSRKDPGQAATPAPTLVVQFVRSGASSSETPLRATYTLTR